MPLPTPDLAALSKLLEQAMELPVHERTRWLDDLPKAHAGLRTWLRELLERDAAGHTADLLGTLPKLERLTPDRTAGEQIGPYRLLRPIGQGGMGTVWLAERSDGVLTRPVALKLPLIATHPLMRQRLARERDILAQLTHPNIARLYDAGVDAAGQPYLAMEYVEGVSITDYCAAHPISVAERVALFAQVADAVAHAHAHLVLHRDLKPSNILVTQEGQVRLLDFGIARLLQDDDAANGAPDSDLTQQAGRPMTPDYAAPEQILGQAMAVPSDVYGLGVVLYETLTGQRPYHLARDASGSYREAILNAKLLPPSHRVTSPAARRQLAGDLDTIVLKALKPAPAERYATVNALVDDLNRWQQQQPILARPDSAWYRLRKFVARNRLPTAAAAAVLLALLGGGGAALWQARAAASERDRALALLERNEVALDFTEVMLTEAVPGDSKVSRAELMTRSEQIALRSFAGHPAQLASVLRMLASHYATGGDYLKARGLLEQAAKLAATSDDLTLKADIGCYLAWNAGATGDFESAKRSLIGWIVHKGLDTPTAAGCELFLSQLCRENSDPKCALEQAISANRRLATMARPPPMMVESSLTGLASAHLANGNNDQADKLFEQSLKTRRELGRDRGDEYLTLLNMMAKAAYTAGDPRRALELTEEGLRLSAVGAPDGQPPAYAVQAQSVQLLLLGRSAEARAAAERAVAMSDDIKDVLLKAGSLAALSAAYRDEGNLDQAEATLAQADASAKTVPSSRSWLPNLEIARARLALLRGRVDEAAAMLGPALASLEKQRGRSPAFMNALRTRAEVLWQQGNRAGALKDAQRALDIAVGLQGKRPHSSYSGQCWLLLARLHQDAGDRPAAKVAFKNAAEHLGAVLGEEHPDTRTARQALAS
jgi:eukaryotic-like serine/threonine-protein kinase